MSAVTRRPWGEWRILASDTFLGYKTKRIDINPGQSISLQYHNYRSETWTVVGGEGKILVDDTIVNVRQGDSIFVPKLAPHKVWCTSYTPLIVIETQIGNCDENDIVRLNEDDHMMTQIVEEKISKDKIVS